jgi:DNA polymerase-3 subunit delta
MNLKGQQAAKYLSAPDPKKAGLLIFGADAMRVALKRQEAILALVGPQGEAEMRLTRLPAADLRKDGAALSDAMRSQGFFPGPRVVFVEEATDGMASLLAGALREWRPGDAAMVVTAGNLTNKSPLKKLFDESGDAV